MLHISKKTEKTHEKALIIEAVMSLMLFSVFFSAAAQASDITAESVINLVNKARISANVAVLKNNDLLQKAAEQKAQDMIDNNYFAHVSPQGKSPWDFIESNKYDYHYAGENLAINFTSVKDQQQAWMDSPTHRQNILNPDYQEIGVAVKKGNIDGHMTTVTVQEFGTKMPEAVNVVSNSKVAQLNSGVAGINTASHAMQNQTNVIGNIAGKVDVQEFFRNNPMTAIGWICAFGIAILIIIVDVAALIHKRHEQFMILRDARNRHA